jgi:hypothetical protein
MAATRNVRCVQGKHSAPQDDQLIDKKTTEWYHCIYMIGAGGLKLLITPSRVLLYFGTSASGHCAVKV